MQTLEPARAVERASRRMRVLTVDSDPKVGDLVSYVLDAAETDVEVAVTASAALALVADGVRPFDVAVVDMGLPDMAGGDLVARIAELRPEVALVLIARDETPPAACDAYLEKPYKPADLVFAVGQAMLARRLR